MVRFGSGCADAAGGGERGAAESAAAAARAARASLGAGGAPRLALLFLSGPNSEDRMAAAFDAARRELGDVPVLGGAASGAVFGREELARDGASVVLLGGDLEVATASVAVASESLLELVPVGAALAQKADDAARRGLPEFTCLVFAPGAGAFGDGDAVVAAARKGVGQRARLAGAMTGSSLAPSRTTLCAGDKVLADGVALAGIFSAVPFGVAARHGWRPTGRARQVTRSEGAWLVTLDGRPALDVWAADARTAGGDVPEGRTPAAVAYLSAHFALDVRAGDTDEPVVRVPLATRDDGAMQMSASVGEGARTRIVRGTSAGLLDAARQAARAAARGLETRTAGGIVLSCGSRLATLGGGFAREAELVAQELDAPVAGACVLGEIARTRSEVEAFHNATVVVIAVPTGRADRGARR